ncbi:MAG: GNAT family N-acetyltransferase [Bacteroidota bacterium]
MDRITYLARLQQHIESVPKRFFALGENHIQEPVAEGKWSRKQILGHLIDSAANNWQRHARIIGLSEPYQILSYPQDVLARANHWQELAADQLIDLWRSLNQQMLFLISQATDHIETIEVVNPDGKKVPFSFWLEDYIVHLDHHLGQIFQDQLTEDAEYSISTDPARIDLDFVFPFLTDSYWGKGRSKETIRVSIRNSLNFGLYHGPQQIGFARVMTDQAVFAHLCDVFVDPSWRGKGLGKWLVGTAVNQPGLLNMRWSLGTDDAHDLYREFGFEVVQHPEKLMQRVPDRHP